jgi:hypothetical protein
MSDPPAASDAYATDIDRLISDARLLQRYLADSGLLADAALGNSIVAVEKARGSGAEGAAVATLSVEYSRAVNIAKPYISIAELRAFRSPFARGFSSGDRSNAKELAIAVLAVILIFGAVLGFAIIQDVTQNISDLQRIALQNPLQKLSELRRLIYEGALKDPKSAYYLQYQKAANEVSLMFDSANGIMNRTAASSEGVPIGIVPETWQVLSFEVMGKRSQDMLPSGGALPIKVAGVVPNAPSPGGSVVATASGPASATIAPPSETVVGSKSASDPEPLLDGIYRRVSIIGPTDCKPYNADPVRKLYGSANAQFLAAALDKFDDYCLAQTLDINTGAYRPAAVSNTIRTLQEELSLIGVLFLPLVGGLLGSTIYVIYLMINGGLSTSMTWGYIFVRILVGGAFGVIIGWFASPSGSSSTDLAQHISGTPFTLAFLAGFSIESLSNVLLKYSKVPTPPGKRP